MYQGTSMKSFSKHLTTASFVAVAIALGGCASTKTEPAQVSDKSMEMDERQRALDAREAELAKRESMLTPQQVAEGDSLLPPAKPGECYARVFVEPTYKTESEQVLKSAASQRFDVVPPTFTTVEERILVREASERIEVVPATYKMVEEQILVRPASKKLEHIPAVYENVTEQVIDKPAHTVWKKGTGPIQKIDASTGEIMCLVDVPATYKTISKRVVTTPATTREVEIPAIYKTVKKRVVDQPATTRNVEIPAEYDTVTVTKEMEPAKSTKVDIPAEYTTVTRRVKVTPGHLEWRSILCDTNMTQGRIQDVQRALVKAGYDPGPIDGTIGADTMQAVNAYQRAKGLPVDRYLNIATLQSLGVAPN
jgi:hypothetical protein